MAHSNYSDAKLGVETDSGGIPEHSLALYEAKRCNGDGGASSGQGPTLSLLTDRSTGDQFYCPHGGQGIPRMRYRRDPGYTFMREEVQLLSDGWAHYESGERRAELEAQMPTYHPPVHPLRGIRPGA